MWPTLGPHPPIPVHVPPTAEQAACPEPPEEAPLDDPEPELDAIPPEDDPELDATPPEDDPELDATPPEDDPELDATPPEDDPELDPEDAGDPLSDEAPVLFVPILTGVLPPQATAPTTALNTAAESGVRIMEWAPY
jgi:hypothetical protein